MNSDLIILVIIFIFLMIILLIMFMFLKKIIIRINEQSKNYFVDKLQAYDDLIDEKEEILKGLNEKIKNNEYNGYNIGSNNAFATNEQDVYLYDSKNINYLDSNIFRKMKNIDKRFELNEKDLIKRFIKDKFIDKDITYYNQLNDVKEILNRNFVFKLVSLPASEQEKVVREVLKKNSVILDDFKKKNKKFKILDFTSYLKKIIEEIDPFVYVYVGNDDDSLKKINPFIRVRKDETIYKGIYIVYKGKLYDFCLK